MVSMLCLIVRFVYTFPLFHIRDMHTHTSVKTYASLFFISIRIAKCSICCVSGSYSLKMRRHVIMSLFLFLLVVDSKISRRFKRQTIPSQHIRVSFFFCCVVGHLPDFSCLDSFDWLEGEHGQVYQCGIYGFKDTTFGEVS